MVKEATIKRDIISLLRRYGGSVTATDIYDFRSKLSTSGAKPNDIIAALRQLKFGSQIKIKRYSGGYRIRLRQQVRAAA